MGPLRGSVRAQECGFYGRFTRFTRVVWGPTTGFHFGSKPGPCKGFSGSLLATSLHLCYSKTQEGSKNIIFKDSPPTGNQA